MTLNIDQLKKKIIYRSNYRGTKEMDKLLGSFTKRYIDELNLNDLFDLEYYKKQVTTIGKLIEYPEGRGWARDIEIDGSLVVETISGEMINLTSPLISEVK